MFFCFFVVLVTNNEFQGVWGQLPWPSTATGLLCDRAATGYDPPIDEHRHKTRPGTLRLVARPRAASRRRSRPHARRHLRASRKSSCGCLQRRRAAPPSRHRVGEARDGGQPAAEAQQQQKSRQPSQGSCLAHLPPFWRSTTGLPVRGACGSLLFRQDKKRKQLPTKNNVEK